MNTPTQMNRSSASSAGITPSATLSATALATAYCAGPNICTACLAPLIVTLLNITVEGLVSRFGVSTASSEVKPSLLLVRQLTKAVSAELPRGPISRSICATSLPSPTNDSPTHNLLILAMSNPPGMKPNTKVARCGPGARRCDYPCCSVRKGNSSSPRGPVGRIAHGGKSIIVPLRLQDVWREVGQTEV